MKEEPSLKTLYKNLILLLIVVVIALLPLLINKEAEYAGADGLAKEQIHAINPGYEPWAKAVWEPPSGEIESLIFALQAAIGAGFIFYFFGYLKGKRERANH